MVMSADLEEVVMSVVYCLCVVRVLQGLVVMSVLFADYRVWW